MVLEQESSTMKSVKRKRTREEPNADARQRYDKLLKRSLQFINLSDEPKLSIDVPNINKNPEHLKQLQQYLRTRKNVYKYWPCFSLLPERYEVLLGGPQRLTIGEIQDLILHAVSGGKNGRRRRNREWYIFKRPSSVTNVIVLVVEGMGAKELTENLELFPRITTSTSRASGLKAVQCEPFGGREESIVQVLRKLSSGNARFYSANADASNRKGFSKGQVGKMDLLMSLEDQFADGYPIEGQPDFRHCRYLHDGFKEVSNKSPMFAVDCEMCGTAYGSELTWVSVVNEKLETVYSSLVLPYNKILDYRTRYSGVTRSRLYGVTTRLEDVQEKLKQLLPPDAILVGHSLSGDLRALQLFHKSCIDTSVIYNLTGVRHMKSKLKLLTEKFLGREIQNKGLEGHDPTEDAVAAMELVLLKLQNDFYFGNALYEPDEKVQMEKEKQQQLQNDLFECLDEQREKTAIIAKPDVITTYKQSPTISLIPVNSKHDMKVQMEQQTVENKMTVVHLDVSHCTREDAAARADLWFRKAYKRTYPNGGMLITLFCGNYSSNQTEENSGCCIVRIKHPEYPPFEITD